MVSTSTWPNSTYEVGIGYTLSASMRKAIDRGVEALLTLVCHRFIDQTRSHTLPRDLAQEGQDGLVKRIDGV
jgi:hypothetical protein